jgi:anti-sigma factor RsiW
VNCDETRHLIHGYVDGELDLVRSLEIEQHLRDCAACAQAREGLQALSDSLSAKGLYFKPAASLKDRIRGSLRQAAGAKRAARQRSWRPLALAAAVAAGVLTVGLLRVASIRATEDRIIQDVVTGHARGVVAVHHVDVETSNRHEVKPWLNDKLGYSPNVPDLAGEGFKLLGGRLDLVDNRTVGVLVYQRRKHLIDVFFWPSEQGPNTEASSATTRRGYQLIRWTQGGMAYWVASDLNEEELRQFVELMRSQR